MTDDLFFNNFTTELGLNELIGESKDNKTSVKTHSITVCGYSSLREGEQVRSVFGTVLNAGDCAVSRDLIDRYGFKKGQKLHIEGYGVLTVNDITTGSMRIEIFFDKKIESILFGRKRIKLKAV